MSRRESGFTLIELLMAMALSAIGCFLAVTLLFGLRVNMLDRNARGLSDLGAQLSSLALDERLAKAVAFVELVPGHLAWRRADGMLDTLLWARDTLWLNGRAVIPGVSGFSVRVEGPSWDPDSVDQFVKWKDMDLNRDGHLDQDELDADFSRTLDEVELQRAALIEVGIISADGSMVTLRRALRSRE